MKTQVELDRLNPFSDNGCVKKEYPNDPCSCKRHDPERYKIPDFLLQLRAERGNRESAEELTKRGTEIKRLAKEKAKQEYLLELEKIG